MTNVKLKSWSPFFQAIKAGRKTHDLRGKDRDFRVGDVLTLAEYEPFTGKYTGDEVDVEVTYITSNDTPCAFSSAVLNKDYCILSLKLYSPPMPAPPAGAPPWTTGFVTATKEARP